MADATAPRTRHEEPLALPAESAPAVAPHRAPMLSRPLAALWASMVVGLTAFLVFGSLRIGAGNWIGRTMPVREVWSRFLEYLAGQGASPLLIVAVAAAAAATLVAAGCLLWLSLALEDDRPGTQADQSAGT